MSKKIDYSKYMKVTNKVPNFIGKNKLNKKINNKNKKFFKSVFRIMNMMGGTVTKKGDTSKILYKEIINGSIAGVVIGIDGEEGEKKYGPYYFCFCAKLNKSFNQAIKNKELITMREIIDEDYVCLDTVILEKDYEIAKLKLKLLLRDKGWDVKGIL